MGLSNQWELHHRRPKAFKHEEEIKNQCASQRKSRNVSGTSYEFCIKSKGREIVMETTG